MQMKAALLLAVIALPLASAAQAKDYGPRICVDVRFWNTPGWLSRDGDSAYLRVTPDRTPAAAIRAVLEPVPAADRMLLATSVEGLESTLHQLIEVEGFKLRSLGYEAGGHQPIAICDRARALAQRFGLAFFVFTTPQYARRLAHSGDALCIEDSAAADQDRKLYETLLAANPKPVIFEKVTVVRDRPLRRYRQNADLVQGILINASSPAQAGTLLRAIRPELGRKYAVAPGEGPSMYFFTFHWKTPGWQPRAGDYATAKIRPELKTFDEKIDYVLQDLKDVAPQNRMVQLNTLSGAAELLKEVIETKHFRLACLGYDLEDWDLTTGDEKKDPIAACQYGQALANKYGMDFIVTPDMPMSRKWGKQVAPFINAIKPQCKGLEAEDIDKAIDYQRDLATEIRRANPDIRILHDVGIAPKGVLQTPAALLRYYAGVADLVDGIGVFSVNTPEQNAVMGKYVVGVRPPGNH